MKIWAVLLSPLIGAYFTLLIFIIYYLSRLNIFLITVYYGIYYGNYDLFIYLGISYILPLIVQIFIIEPAFRVISKTHIVNFKFYLSFGLFISLGIGFVVLFINLWLVGDLLKSLKNAYIFTIMFSSYSLFNAITYNYLYFSKLEKETNSPVIPMQEGTEFKIDEE